jgi:hypothetical protein
VKVGDDVEAARSPCSKGNPARTPQILEAVGIALARVGFHQNRMDDHAEQAGSFGA